MQSPLSLQSSVPCAFNQSLAFARFPNAPFFAPIFSGRQTPPVASSSQQEAFFSEFESPLVEAARRHTAPTAEILFDAFGFASLDEFSRRFDRSPDVPSTPLLFADARGARFLLLAPTSTLRLLFTAALGFDVEAICANEALWSDFNADAQTPLTFFEKETGAQEAVRFATLSPVSSFSTAPFDSLSFPQTPTRAALELDAALFYWERRFLRLSNRLFPWTLVFSTSFLAPLAEAALSRQSTRSNSLPLHSPSISLSTQPAYLSPVAQPSTATTSPQSTQLFYSTHPSQSLQNARSFQSTEPRPSGEQSNSSSPANPSSCELSIVVERGEMPAESWRRLKPGDVLRTNVPANALFLGLIDDAPRFLCRPGLFRGAAAVQIKSRADDARE